MMDCRLGERNSIPDRVGAFVMEGCLGGGAGEAYWEEGEDEVGGAHDWNQCLED